MQAVVFVPLFSLCVLNQLTFDLNFCMYRVGQKAGPRTHDHNSVKS